MSEEVDIKTFAETTDTSDDGKNDKDNEAAFASTKPSLAKLFELAKPEIPMLVFSGILMIGSESTQMITPLVIANAYDTLVDPDIEEEDERFTEINRYMLIAILITIGGIIAGFVRATIQGVIGERMVARLRCRLYKQILKQEMYVSFFDTGRKIVESFVYHSTLTQFHSFISSILRSIFAHSLACLLAYIQCVL